jgi:diaminohydroxyphosphoribosylaminopyrimidine deaminase / 5-amino-6-(5-phosphoribosylamino)uracil reductase
LLTITPRAELPLSSTVSSQPQVQRHFAALITKPNPAVFCLIDSPGGQALGHTQPRGGAHAEIMALRAAKAQGLDLSHATVHVSLEPCAHHGRTPPCTAALIEAGVKKVVVAILDPNPLVAGKGVQQLRDAGLEVELLPADHPKALASRELNLGFFSRMVRRTPWVRMKLAASLDGVTALESGQSQWITSEAARADGQALRARSCAVLTGIGTVLQDDPLLNVRALINTPEGGHGSIPAPRQPHLVVVDSRLETPLDANLWSTLGQRGQASTLFEQETVDMIAPRKILIYHASSDSAKITALQAQGATLIHLPEASSEKVDLTAVLQNLALQQEINDLHVEAGYKLNGSLFKAGLVDEVIVYTAPKLLGSGMGLAHLPTLPHLDALPPAQQLEFKSAELIGQDLRVVARVRGRDRF